MYYVANPIQAAVHTTQRDYIPEQLYTHECRPIEIQVPSEISSSVFDDAQMVLMLMQMHNYFLTRHLLGSSQQQLSL